MTAGTGGDAGLGEAGLGAEDEDSAEVVGVEGLGATASVCSVMARVEACFSACDEKSCSLLAPLRAGEPVSLLGEVGVDVRTTLYVSRVAIR